jgi:hypothetical protein
MVLTLRAYTHKDVESVVHTLIQNMIGIAIAVYVQIQLLVQKDNPDQLIMDVTAHQDHTLILT